MEPPQGCDGFSFCSAETTPKDNSMWQAIKDGWHDLSPTGRTIIVTVFIVAAAVLLWFAMFWRYDLTWLPKLLGGQ